MNFLNKNLAESLFRLRMVENEISKRYSHQEMRCPVHLVYWSRGSGSWGMQ